MNRTKFLNILNNNEFSLEVFLEVEPNLSDEITKTLLGEIPNQYVRLIKECYVNCINRLINKFNINKIIFKNQVIKYY